MSTQRNQRKAEFIELVKRLSDEDCKKLATLIRIMATSTEEDCEQRIMPLLARLSLDEVLSILDGTEGAA